MPKGGDPRNAFPLKSIKEFKFLDGAAEGLKKLADKNYRFVLVTNQTFLGTPKNSRKLFDQIMARIDAELGKYGLKFDCVAVCIHGPDQGCDCRKPKIGGELKKWLQANQGQIDF